MGPINKQASYSFLPRAPSSASNAVRDGSGLAAQDGSMAGWMDGISRKQPTEVGTLFCLARSI